MSSARYIVGIDLGTTNSALAHVEVSGARSLQADTVEQLVAAGDVAARATLPSFLYLQGEHELSEKALQLPWSKVDSPPQFVVGELARTQGAQVPARLVSSAKSWLCHGRIDPTVALLPWGSGETAQGGPPRKISPVDASAAYLRHMADSFAHQHGGALAEQDVILGIPASFDEVARELTLKAAAQVGLSPTLLEEPQAAFYAWVADHLAQWQDYLTVGDVVLVCDIGGGTTDFSLIEVKGVERGKPIFERTAVGDHLLLGGDNMDLTIARRVEQRLTSGGKLDAFTFQALVQACRLAKERLLSDEDRPSWSVTVQGRGSRLIGGALHDELKREEVETLVLDGFFPRVAFGGEDAAKVGAKSGIQEYGLPYASDPAITRHASHFLRLHAARPTAVLWNGGVLKSAAIRARILQTLGDWMGKALKVLDNTAPDLAVARGAAYFGLARRGEGLRISGGAARAYYIGLDTASVSSGAQTVMCLTPRGFAEGAEVTLSEQPLELLTNQPVRFHLYSSSDRTGDRAGELIKVEKRTLVELPPMYTALRFTRSSQQLALSVHLHARLTEHGTLELECVARSTGNEGDRWRLNFDLRNSEPAAPPSESADRPALPPGFERALEKLRAVFGPQAGGESPTTIMKSLQEVLGPKDTWSTTALRGFFEPLKDLRGGRGKSGEHEARWLNLVGFALRPGFGYPLDDWRVREMWRLFHAGVVHDKVDACRLEWWILWRRISGGLSKTQQDELYKRLAPHFVAAFAKKTERRDPSKQEAAEMWRTLASLERLSAKQKAELGEILIGQLEKKNAPQHALWALGRLGTRVPLYGSVQDVVSPQKATRWLDRLAAIALTEGGSAARSPRGGLGTPPGVPNKIDWTQETFALCAAELARCSGDRVRDLDEPVRLRLAERFKPLSDGARLARLVLEPVPREAREEKLAFGDALPSGLRLAAEYNA